MGGYSITLDCRRDKVLGEWGVGRRVEVGSIPHGGGL